MNEHFKRPAANAAGKTGAGAAGAADANTARRATPRTSTTSGATNPYLQAERPDVSAGHTQVFKRPLRRVSQTSRAPEPQHPQATRPYPQASPAQTPFVPHATQAPLTAESHYGAAQRRPLLDRPHPRRHPRFAALATILWFVLLLCYGLLALRTLPAEVASGKAIPELVSLVPWAIPVAGICLIGALVSRRPILGFFSAVALVVNVAWHWGFFVPAPTARITASASATVSSANAGDNAARIMTLNTYNGHADPAQIVQIVAQNHVEVLCLEEITTDFVSALEAAGINNYLPYHVVAEGASQISNGGRNGIWTLAPQSNVSGNLLPINTSSMPAADIALGDKNVRVVAVHPNSPIRGAESEWAAGLSVIKQLNDYDHAYLVMGDFNSTVDHARFRELLGSRFADAGSSAGEFFHPTYPSSDSIPPLVEIDHIVYSKSAGIVVSNLATLRVAGTDHLALLGTLEVQNAG